MDDEFGTCLYVCVWLARMFDRPFKGIPINSIQQFLTTFVTGRVIIILGSSELHSQTFRQHRNQNRYSLLARNPKLSCSSRIAVIAVSGKVSFVKNKPNAVLGYATIWKQWKRQTSYRRSTAHIYCTYRLHITRHFKDH